MSIAVFIMIVMLPIYKVTAYCPDECCCQHWADGVTTSGHVIEPGDCFVAAPERFSFNTRMIIPGYNNGESVPVLDRGGKIKGNCIDVFFNDHWRAVDWGVQYFIME